MEGPRKKNGGRRPGAGRPPGVHEPLPRGVAPAIKAGVIARRRLGANADPDSLAALERVFERVAVILEGDEDPGIAGPSLKAAALIADSVAGPVKQHVEHSGGVSVAIVDPYARPGQGEDDGE